MKSIKFRSIFRREDGQQPALPSEPTGHSLLAQQLGDRRITLNESDLKPLTEQGPPLDWVTVNGQVTLLASTIEGLLEGRPRITAEHLKRLTPSPVGAEVPDATEYSVSLAAVIPQIEDLLQPTQAETGPSTENATSRPPEFETPFTVLANEDSQRLGTGSNNSRDPREETAPLAEQLTQQSEQVDRPSFDETSRDHGQEPPLNLVPAPMSRFRRERKPEVDPRGEGADGLRNEPGDGPSGRGVEQLQEIFMVNEPLDGRRVALLLRQFPEVTGALILLEGGAVLGGQLPEALNREAALQAPEVLAQFIRFIGELEAGREVQSYFISVNSATTISLVRSGQVVLLVSHQRRKLPPGLAHRLTETAEALNLIYGKSCT
jgi:hypothetical protein